MYPPELLPDDRLAKDASLKQISCILPRSERLGKLILSGCSFTFHNSLLTARTFSILGSHLCSEFEYLGLHISQKKELNLIELDQIEYIEQIVPIHVSRDRQSNNKEFCTKEESFQFHQLVGKLSWIALQH